MTTVPACKTAERLDAILAVVEYTLLNEHIRTSELDLLSRRAAAALKAMTPSELVQFISGVMSIGLELGNILDGNADAKEFAKMVSYARGETRDEMSRLSATGPTPQHPHAVPPPHLTIVVG